MILHLQAHPTTKTEESCGRQISEGFPRVSIAEDRSDLLNREGIISPRLLDDSQMELWIEDGWSIFYAN